MIRAVRSKFPDAQIDFLTKASYGELVRFNPHLSSVIEFDGNKTDGGIRPLAAEIRKRKYDVILDLQNNLRSKFLRFFSGARETRVVNKRIIPRFLLVHGVAGRNRNYYPDKIPVPLPLRYLETGSDFGIQDDGAGLELFLPATARASVDETASSLQFDKFRRVIALAPTARHNTKMWPAERFVEYGSAMIRSHGAKVIILGGEADRPRCGEIAAAIADACGKATVENFAGKFSILETAAMLDFSDVVVTNDTGLMHIAAARGRKIVSIFGPTVEEFGFFPFRTPNIVLQTSGLPCRPCSHIGGERCPQGHFLCMKSITTAQVLDATGKMLGG